LFQQRGHQVDYINTMPESELIKIIGDYDGKSGNECDMYQKIFL